MENADQSDRLTWGDTVFLHLEREGMPLNVASVCTFEGQISFADCVRFVESKLPLIPRYLKRVVSAPLGLGLPSWEYDPEFVLKRHLRTITLKNGTQEELKTLAGKLFSTVMDRQHPLWDMTLVRGLKGNRTAIIFRLHHCLADGIAGVGIMNLLLDSNPEAPLLPRKKVHLRIPKPHDPLTSITTGFVDSYSDFVRRLLSAMTDLLSMAQRVGENGSSRAGGETSKFFPEITAFTQRLRFNVLYRGPQKFVWTEIPLADVKAIRHKCKTSVNDVILTIVTAAIRKYCGLHGERVKGKLLRIMVPVNLRGKDSPSELGNRISLVPVTIPLDIRQPQKLLSAVHRRTEFLKKVHAAELISLAGGLIGMFPTSVQGLAGPFASQLPITPFNLVCTNVPGPQVPLYLMGHRMLAWYPYVPVGGEMPLNCAILSYDGTVFFGFSGDVHAAPDLKKMERLLQGSFADLRQSTGFPVRAKRRSKKPRHLTRSKSASQKNSPSQLEEQFVASKSVPRTGPSPTGQFTASTSSNVA